ncbi:hypothetical protein LP420_18140 [Massilia sp. B-10]|nr:hypothetical protein LP420_18140 [Massilia sp. B-10]
MLRFSFSMTLRDWRAHELRFLLIALALAVASLTAVQFFSSRMGAAMQRDAHQLLAADLRIAAEAPIDARWRAQAATLGLRSAATVELNSMALAGGGRCRALAHGGAQGGRGRLSLARHPVAARRRCHAGMARPQAAPGSTRPCWSATAWPSVSQIRIGELRLTIARSIASEPDRGPAALVLRAARDDFDGRPARQRPARERRPGRLLPAGGRRGAGCWPATSARSTGPRARSCGSRRWPPATRPPAARWTRRPSSCR